MGCFRSWLQILNNLGTSLSSGSDLTNYNRWAGSTFATYPIPLKLLMALQGGYSCSQRNSPSVPQSVVSFLLSFPSPYLFSLPICLPSMLLRPLWDHPSATLTSVSLAGGRLLSWEIPPASCTRLSWAKPGPHEHIRNLEVRSAPPGPCGFPTTYRASKK